MENLAVAAVIIALVKAVKQYMPNVNGGMTILLATGLGAIAGYFGLEGLTLQSGIMAGLSAVGITTVADRVSANK